MSKYKKTIDIQQYIENQKNVLGADFLLLNELEQTKILKNFGTDSIESLLKDINLSKLWALELLIIENLPEYQLMRRIWILREKFKLQCGDDIYKYYMDSLNENLKTVTDDTKKQLDILRADAVNLARQLQRLNYGSILRFDMINGRKKAVIYSAIFVVFLIFICFFFIKVESETIIDIKIHYADEVKEGMKFILLIIGAGVLGSAISLLQRIEKAANIMPAFTDSIHDAFQISMSMSTEYIISLLFSGAIFALLVDFLAVSQLINILNISAPHITIPYANPSALVRLTLPPDNTTDIAKLLLFCFLSGFAERLVPDILDSLTKKASVK